MEPIDDHKLRRRSNVAAPDPGADSSRSAPGVRAFHPKSDYFRRLLLILDLALVALAYCGVLALVDELRPEAKIDFLAHLGLLPIVLAAFATARAVFGRKVDLGRYTLRTQIACVLKELGIALGFAVVMIFALKLEYFSRFFFVSFVLAVVAVLIGMRLLIIWWYFIKHREATDNYLNVLIIGSGVRARKIAGRIRSSYVWGTNVVGFLDPEGVSAGRRKDDEILGHVNDISKILRDYVVEEVIVAVPRSLLSTIQPIAEACEEEGVRLRFMVDLFDLKPARVHLTMVQDVPLVTFEAVAQNEFSLIAKRIFDLIATLVMLPIIAPLFAIVAIAIKVDSPGPVFFTQNRVGLHKRKFEMYKFRSMVVDAEERMKEIEHLNEAQGANFKIKNDPRVTRVGRILRKSSIDELPQLINVVKGDMSLVGPRPMSLRDVSLFDKGVQRKRFSVRPGITGLWQVSGRSDLAFDRWIELDLRYIETWSLGLDIKILFKTVPAVLKGSGAV